MNTSERQKPSVHVLRVGDHWSRAGRQAQARRAAAAPTANPT